MSLLWSKGFTHLFDEIKSKFTTVLLWDQLYSRNFHGKGLLEKFPARSKIIHQEVNLIRPDGIGILLNLEEDDKMIDQKEGSCLDSIGLSSERDNWTLKVLLVLGAKSGELQARSWKSNGMSVLDE